MPSVFVVPVYVELPAGFERAIVTLESILRRAGYTFHTGELLPHTLEECKEANDGQLRTGRPPGPRGQECLPELRGANPGG